MSQVGRVWKTSKDDKVQWITMGESHMEGALTILRESFMKNESLSIVTRIAQRPAAAEQMQHICTLIAQDNASIVAVEKATGKVIGVAFNKITRKGSTSFLETFSEQPGIDAGYAEVLDFVSKVEEKVDVFAHYKAEAVLDHMFLVTHQDYYRQGIGLGLVASTVHLAKALKSVQAVIAIFTGLASQKIGKKLGWDVLANVPYDSESYEGEKYSDRLAPDTQKSVFMGCRV